MAIHYTIRAEVVDIRHDVPRPNDTFLVDTNVWYWITYPRASQAHQPPRLYQTSDYPAYLSQAISAKARLLRCGLSLTELAHLIEKTEREIFIRSHGPVPTKEYRHNHPSERSHVVAEIQAAWGQVKMMAVPIDILVDEPTTDAALRRLTSEPLDGYDLLILEAIAKVGVVQVITDDGDFASVPGLQVFTSNQNVIQAARHQGKLLRR
jgi:predicted nucleic acid-binding protein